jgi:hypothetical protein
MRNKQSSSRKAGPVCLSTSTLASIDGAWAMLAAQIVGGVLLGEAMSNNDKPKEMTMDDVFGGMPGYRAAPKAPGMR